MNFISVDTVHTFVCYAILFRCKEPFSKVFV